MRIHALLPVLLILGFTACNKKAQNSSAPSGHSPIPPGSSVLDKVTPEERARIEAKLREKLGNKVGPDENPVDKLSPGSRMKLEAAVQEKLDARKAACGADVEKFCPNTEKGPARRDCMQAHLKDLSAACKAIIAK